MMLVNSEEKVLIKRTREYWQQFNSADPCGSLTTYIHNLLPGEMAYAKKQDRLPANPLEGRVLVLMVGHSIEPLLQTIWAYKPTTIYLVLNQNYGMAYGGQTGRSGDDQFDLISDLLEEVTEIEAARLRDDMEIKRIDLDNTTPPAVFQSFLESIADCEDVIIDITGAKKSMVTGAYLYAAFGNVPVSYVDFEDEAYDPEFRRPYGFSCIIRPFENPYNVFALRDWEQISELYKQYRYNEALVTLEKMTFDVSDYLATIHDSIEWVKSILQCYAQWQDGNYKRARELAAKIGNFTPPEGVQRLGSDWVQTRGNEFVVPTGIYADECKVKIYAIDEINRIGRLIALHHDYRSAFLRLGGLNEILLNRRIVNAAPDISISIYDDKTPARTRFRKLANGGELRIAGITVQIGTPMHPWWIAGEKAYIQAKNRFAGPNGWKSFFDRRNDLTHTFVSIPKEWADDALNFVQAHLKDLWPDLDFENINLDTGELNWPQALEFTGLFEHLPPNLRN